MKQNPFLKSILLILLCILLGGVFVVIANYLPINQTNKSESLSQLASEGLFPQVPSMEGGYGDFHSETPTTLELATDSLMLKMALYEGEGSGITQAFRCYSTQYEEEYSRYWHGYVIILRILLLFFDYYELRIINGFLQGALVIALLFYLRKEKSTKYVLAFATSYILLMPQAMAQCFQYSWAFYVTFLGLFLYFRKKDYWDKNYNYFYLFTFIGALTIYLDLLTFPLLSWGLLIVWVLLLDSGYGKAMDYLKKVVLSGIAWIMGYSGMWLGKWVLGSIVLRENLFQKAISEALLWTVNEGSEAITLADRFKALYINWNPYSYRIYFIILLAWFIFFIYQSLTKGLNKSVKAPALLLVSLSSFVWYMFLAGHTTMHHIFTHRIWGVSIAAFIGIIVISTNTTEKATGCAVIIKRLALYAIICLLAIGSSLLLRDDYTLHNGPHEFTVEVISTPISMSFVPVYGDVRQIYVGLQSPASVEGYYNIILQDGAEVLYENPFPISDFTDKNIHLLDVDWELEAGHSYTLSLEPTAPDCDTQVWITTNGNMPLQEFGPVSTSDITYSGQMLAGMTYYAPLQSKYRTIFYIFTFAVIYCMVGYVIYSQRRNKA